MRIPKEILEGTVARKKRDKEEMTQPNRMSEKKDAIKRIEEAALAFDEIIKR